jgi:integrase
MELMWSDFDFERGMLTVRPDLGKTKQERRGRVIPVSPHLLTEVAGWGRREGFLIDNTPARGPQPKKRQVHNGHVKRIWRKTSVPEDRYRQPCHCFRKGFVSELVRAGATERAVRRLVGHSGGVTFDVYTSAWAMEDELRQAVALVPAMVASEEPNVFVLGSEGVPEGSAAPALISEGSDT